MSHRRSSHIRGHTATRGSSRGLANTTPPSSQDSTPAGSRLGSPAFPTVQTEFSQPTTPPNVTEDDDTIPPVIISPIKKCAPRVAPAIKKLSDLEVWEMNDNIIIAAAFHNARSSVYNHYDTLVDHVIDKKGNKVRIDFVFKCKSDPTGHLPHRRSRLKTSAGTGNLVIGETQCLKRQGIVTSNSRDSSLVYSETLHHVLICIHCATNARPFNIILDKWYRMEVEMLRPGTVIPHPTTVSHDLQSLYLGMSKYVAQYLSKSAFTLHLVLDGWTSPLTSSFLGVVVIWCKDGILYRTILEFIRLKESHTGEYMAQLIQDCLIRFGIEDQVFSICMDNASNCDKLAVVLGNKLPTFEGANARIWCFAHILNLIAKAFISFFFKQKKTKKSIKITKTTGRQLAWTGKVQAPIEAEEVILEPGDDDGNLVDRVVAEESEFTVNAIQDDDGHAAFNNSVVRSVRDCAIQDIKKIGIYLNEEEVQMASHIFPKVAGLARRVHDSPTLKEAFDNQVQAYKKSGKLVGDKNTLDRRVPTRWNSDLVCLEAHIYFKQVIQSLIATNPSLKSYELTEEEWELADLLDKALVIFEAPTKLFSQSEVPMIVDVIPILDKLRNELIGLQDDNENDVLDIVRVAAQAALMMVDKYSLFTTDCDIYQFAIVLCPDRKLKWFKDHGFSTSEIKDIKKCILARFTQHYAADRISQSTGVQQVKKRSPFVIQDSDTPTTPLDHLQTYLAEPVIPLSQIRDTGGYLKWWSNASNQRPQIAKMALDYCSTPASSVDAERAFSVGRRQVNFLQHNMTSQSFKARMAVGSWVNSPVCPPLSELEKILQGAIKPKDTKGKKAQQVASEGDSESGEDFGNMSANDEDDDENEY